jgi:hypothetical protein
MPSTTSGVGSWLLYALSDVGVSFGESAARRIVVHRTASQTGATFGDSAAGSLHPHADPTVPPPVESGDVGPPELTTLARSLLADLPPYEADDPVVQNLLRAVSLELARIDARAHDIIIRLFPQDADDRWRTLGMWETMLGLPVESTISSRAARSALVTASVRGRNVSSGAHWTELIGQALVGVPWTQEEVVPYTVVIRIPAGSSGYSTGQIRVFARKVSPAHLVIESGTIGGFLIGISLIGDAL